MLGREISVPQAKALWDRGDVTFFDARIPAEFAEGHVEGAINLTGSEMSSAQGVEKTKFADRSLPVVIYCGGGLCDASHLLAQMLELAGYTQIHIMKDGFPAWQQAGHPTQK